MFRCNVCGELVAPKVKPLRVITHTRAKEYDNAFYVEDELGNRELKKVHSFGHEPVQEINACQTCGVTSGLIESVEPKPVVKVPGKAVDVHNKPFHTSLASIVVHNTLHKRIDHNTKRAERDCNVVVPLVKSFVDGNPKFLF